MTASPLAANPELKETRHLVARCRRVLSVLLILSASTLLAGCVTTVTGTVREEAPEGARVKAQIDLARGYLAENNLQAARRPLTRALEIDSRSVEANVLKAIVHQREDEPALAEKHYKIALRADPNNAQALNNYGGFLYSQGRTKAALVPLRKSVKDTSYSARSQAFLNLGLVEFSLDHVDKARDAFQRSLMLNSNLVQPHLELADIYFAEGNMVRSAEHYAQFRNGARQTPRSLCLGLRLATQLQQPDEESSFRMALKNLYPGSEEARTCEADDA